MTTTFQLDEVFFLNWRKSIVAALEALVPI